MEISNSTFLCHPYILMYIFVCTFLYRINKSIKQTLITSELFLLYLISVTFYINFYLQL